MSEEINKAEETKVEEESLAAEETRMISDEARWYVVHTYSGYENKVKANIEKTVENRGMQDQIFEVSVPLQDVVEMKDGRKKTVQRKVFPGYVLLNMIMNDETWYVVRNTRCVTSFVGPGLQTRAPDRRGSACNGHRRRGGKSGCRSWRHCSRCYRSFCGICWPDPGDQCQ